MLDTVPYFGETLHRWRIGRSTFLASPARGARLLNWCLTLADGTDRDVIHWPEITTLDGFSSVRGGNPILFPFSARTFDRGDIHFWRADDGVRRPMPMHGLARQGLFNLTRADDSGFAAVFQPDPEARACYPFGYEFTVAYRFSPAKLTCEFVLKNLDRVPIPWSAGHHFYFTVPWEPDRTRADYVLDIPASRRLRQDSAGQLVRGPDLPSSDSLARPEWIETLHLGLTAPVASIAPVGPDRVGAIEVSIGLNKKTVPAPDATFVTWSANSSSPFFCVEPWMGPPNAAEHKVGLHFVDPGKSQSFAVQVALAD
ncbi:MAG: aldose epimerase [Verrucomicrobia bacterium]|nr:MAG: aldose epimerase [Verrucomicrobiota bacterium]